MPNFPPVQPFRPRKPLRALEFPTSADFPNFWGSSADYAIAALAISSNFAINAR